MASATDLSRLLLSAPEEAGPHLLGCHLVSLVGGAEVRIKLTEVEAYKGGDDPASHAFRGRTRRNGSMFERPGTLYVYRSYGIHNCANTSAGPEGVGWGILMRGGEVIEGMAEARRRRNGAQGLADGPGKLTQALGIDMGHDGIDLLDPASPVRLEPADPPEVVMATPRIGISKARERPWRFVAAAQLSG